jgi:hypothetical protein
MGHSSTAAALRYQHVMAGRDAAIAADPHHGAHHETMCGKP